MVKLWVPPEFTVTVPEGVMEPFALAVAVIVYVAATNVAEML